MTEGSLTCFKTSVPYHAKRYRYRYPAIYVVMCDRQALEPASRVFGTTIVKAKSKQQKCPTELFPPDGKGIHLARVVGTRADKIMQHLNPLLSDHAKQKWQRVLSECR